ncbi:LuxR C-terminal-related transcriptional regulator [Nonomuraea sp. NPDC003707]
MKRHVHGLPYETTSFVGRRREIAEVKRLLADSRMVTLTGVGGVGKTRLACRVALEVHRGLPDGVWLVELAGLRSSVSVTQSLIESLEIRDQSARPTVEVLEGHLRDKHLLLVLDNCEHLRAECAMLTERILRFAPEVHILATSRERLGTAGEYTFSLPPLSQSSESGSALSKDGAAKCDAVQLFAERARAVVPAFALTASNRDVVERICRRLDGLPLAIELAAVRLRALSVEQLHDRLDDRFQLLTAGSELLPRHQTLKALFDWSYGLCTDQERLLWARMSVFTGGLDLDAAEAVCSDCGLPRADMVKQVIGLVDKSIILREERSSRVRYRLPETIRQYGYERLRESGEEADLRRRHRDYYCALAAEARSKLLTPGEVECYGRLEDEHSNVRSALEYCFNEKGHAELGLSMASDLLWHWITNYHFHEGRWWLRQGLDAVCEESEVRARALWSASLLAVVQGDIAAGESMLAESCAIGESLGLDAVLAYATYVSGIIAYDKGEVESAISLFERSAEAQHLLGDDYGYAMALTRLSIALSSADDLSRATSVGEECVTVCQAHGEGWVGAFAKAALGIALCRRDDVDRARVLAQESLLFNRSLNRAVLTGLDMELLSWVAAADRRFERAATLLGALHSIWRAIGGHAILPIFGHLYKFHEMYEDRTRQALGEHSFRAAVDRGAALSYEEAISYALEELGRNVKPAEDAGNKSPLTRREMEVARLVARGMTNKEIASTLVISQRTAEGHIEHILVKLGFNSRTQIVKWISNPN